jgi:succinyl-CoA synthetase beta subunit
MYLLEHDAKEILAHSRIPVPAGCLVESAQALRDAALPPGPWVVKGQIAAGGRGKAGLVMKAATVDELHARVGTILGMGEDAASQPLVPRIRLPVRRKPT